MGLEGRCTITVPGLEISESLSRDGSVVAVGDEGDEGEVCVGLDDWGRRGSLSDGFVVSEAIMRF